MIYKWLQRLKKAILGNKIKQTVEAQGVTDPRTPQPAEPDNPSNHEIPCTEHTKEGQESMFIAAGRPYLSAALLKAKKEDDLDGVLYRGFKVPVYRDLFGRRLLYFQERFPCFDSFDRLYEKRYYHWYAIENGGKVTLVYTEDEQPGAKVHENYQPDAKTTFYSPSWIDRELVNAGLFKGQEG